MNSNRRLREPEEIKKRVTGDIRKLNRRLVDLASRLDAEARRHSVARTPPGRVLTSFYRKAVKTAQAIEVLKAKKLIEEAWILLRVLLETHVNLLYFMRNDPKDMTMRYLDASVLDKLKHLREVNFYEDTQLAGLHSRTKWEATEAEISGRYPSDDFRAIKRNGFSGLTFEQRAKAVGLKTMYEFCYRIASRSVHMFDPADTPLSVGTFKRGEKFQLLRLRRNQLETNQNMLLGRISYIVAEFVNSHLALELILIGLGYEKFRDGSRTSVPLPLATEGQHNDAPGTFRVWRE